MTTTTQEITISKSGHVATITIDRPPNNHVSVGLMRDLADALEAIDRDPETRAVVLATAGKAFCAGADLVSTDGLLATGMGGINALYDQAVRLYGIETPIVAAIQGAAVGAGLGLALVADFRVAAPEARFTSNFVKLGFHPGFGLTYTLTRLIGEQKAALMHLTGRRLKAEEALAWGLVDQVVPLDQLLGAAQALAAEIAENAPLAVVATRKSIRGEMAAGVREATNRENVQQTILRATEDYAEGVKAVQERRVGNFKGR
jgi:enoyl-CoA hydratase/carnithine racemase